MAGRGVKDFLGKAAPTGYIAGLGRGATGFVTRPDLGPGSSVSVTPAVVKAGDEEDRFEDNDNEEGLLAARGPLGQDDEEADAVFAMIDAKMSERRRTRRAKPVEQPTTRVDDPTTLFAAEKLKLRQVSAAEWAQLPESGDFIAKRAKKSSNKERYTPVPDSVLLGGSGMGATMASGMGVTMASGMGVTMASGMGATMASGMGVTMASGMGITMASGAETDFRSVGEAREKVLGARLDMASGTATSTSIDPIGYLTGLNEQVSTSVQVNDLRRARILLKCAIQSNPQNPSAWISAARIEEVAQNVKLARTMLNDAIEACPESEDIWAEAIRVATPQEAPPLTERALARLPRSSKLWLLAVEKERDAISAKRLLRRALEENTDSPLLWKALIEREEDAEDARVLLSKAVECCPASVELWIALARLETHENARKVLNKARQMNPMSVAVWLAAARLEEAHGNHGGIVSKIIQRAIVELAQNGVAMDRPAWLKEAINCEATGDQMCAVAIVRTTATAELDLELDDIKSIWLSDSKRALENGANVVAKALLELLLEKFPTEDDLWKEMIKMRGKDADVDIVALYEEALSKCPQSTRLWLDYAHTSTSPLGVLERAVRINPANEVLWTALYRCAKQSSDVGARNILERARENVVSDKIWKISIGYEQKFGDIKDAIHLSDRALALFPKSELVWLATGRINPSRWEDAILACPNSASIRIEAARMLASSQAMKARAILEKGRLLLPDNPKVWIASIKLEIVLDAPAQSRSLLTRGLQRCPESGALWYEAIALEARPLKKAKAMEALRKCPHNGLVFLAIARIMEAERSVSGAADYYERALAAGSNIGDIWAYYINFCRRHDDLQKSDRLVSTVMELKPKEGPQWRPFRKEDKWRLSLFVDIFDAFLCSLDS